MTDLTLPPLRAAAELPADAAADPMFAIRAADSDPALSDPAAPPPTVELTWQALTPVRAATRFIWPTPPLAAYPLPQPLQESEPCEVEGRNGHLIVGHLLSFDPGQSVLRVQVPPERVPMRLRLNQVRRLRLTRPLAPLTAALMADTRGTAPARLLAHHPSQPYTVQLTGGGSVAGRTIAPVDTRAGVFFFEPHDALGTVLRSFVPRAAIGQLDLGERLGVLLMDNEVSADAVERGVALQQRLRSEKLGERLLARQVLTRAQLYEALDRQARQPTTRLGEALVDLGFITVEQLQEALHEQDAARAQSLGEVLVGAGLVTPDQVRVALARKLGYPVVAVDSFPAEPAAVAVLSAGDAQRLRALPLALGGDRLAVALDDPSDAERLQALEALTGHAVAPALALGDLAAAIGQAYAEAGAAAAAVAAATVASVTHDTAASPDTATRERMRAALAGIHLELDGPGPAAADAGAAAPAGGAPSSPDVAVALADDPAAHPAERIPPALAPASSVATPSAASEPARAASDRSSAAALAEDGVGGAPVLPALIRLIEEALAAGATAVHLEASSARAPLVIRLRREGRLHDHGTWPAAQRGAVLARLKTLANLSPGEQRRPQQGRFAFGRLSPRHPADLRVQVLPTHDGLEDAVITLPVRLKPRALDRLGLSATDLGRYQGLLRRPSGLLLVAGPARSGQTTTLHAALAALVAPERRIWTLEDRLEIRTPGLRQMELPRRLAGEGEAALRSLMDSDADVIMIASLAEPGLARLALEAALSGRLVLAGIRARHAGDAVQRLLDQGLPSWDLADALIGVQAQHLLQRLCSTCRMARSAKETEVDEWLDGYLHGAPVEDLDAEREALRQRWIADHGRDGRLRRYQSPGCERCGGTGLRPHLAVHELLVPGRELRRLIRAGAPSWHLQRQALRDGMTTLRQDAVEKMVAGLTSLDEVRNLVGY